MKTPLAIVAALLLAIAAAQAAPHGPDPKSTSSKSVSSPAQVDGILSSIVDQLWEQNDRYWHRGDYPRIIALDKIIVQIDPHFIDCYTTGAWLMWSSGLDRDAETFYRECIRHNPRTSAAYYDYGFFLYNHLHRYADARRVFQRSALLSDGSVLEWRMLAHSYEKLGLLDEAIVTWRQIKTRWPNGAPGDTTSGAVDTNNLNKDLALFTEKKSVPAP